VRQVRVSGPSLALLRGGSEAPAWLCSEEGQRPWSLLQVRDTGLASEKIVLYLYCTLLVQYSIVLYCTYAPSVFQASSAGMTASEAAAFFLTCLQSHPRRALFTGGKTASGRSC